jgi:hypothetical protein
VRYLSADGIVRFPEKQKLIKALCKSWVVVLAGCSATDVIEPIKEKALIFTGLGSVSDAANAKPLTKESLIKDGAEIRNPGSSLQNTSRVEKQRTAAPVIAKIKLPAEVKVEGSASLELPVAKPGRTYSEGNNADGNVADTKARLSTQNELTTFGDIGVSGEQLRASSWRVRTGWYFTEGVYPDPLSAQITKDGITKKGFRTDVVETNRNKSGQSNEARFVLLVGPYYSKAYAKIQTQSLMTKGSDRSSVVFIGR